ncbi:MAG: hypothetical protein ACI4CT_05310 [Lachnospiraceae bacterium]
MRIVKEAEERREEILSESGISAKAVDIQEYVTATYGRTIQEIRMAAWAAVMVAAQEVMMECALPAPASERLWTLT